MTDLLSAGAVLLRWTFCNDLIANFSSIDFLQITSHCKADHQNINKSPHNLVPVLKDKDVQNDIVQSQCFSTTILFLQKEEKNNFKRGERERHQIIDLMIFNVVYKFIF